MLTAQDLHAQARKSAAQSCYTCEITLGNGWRSPSTGATTWSQSKSVTPPDAVCTAPGETPEDVLRNEIYSFRSDIANQQFIRLDDVRCVKGGPDAGMHEVDEMSWGEPNLGFVSQTFAASRAKKSSPTASGGRSGDKSNFTQCLRTVPNAAYGRISLQNTCQNKVEVAYCYFGSSNKAFACSPGRKEGWQRGSASIAPGKTAILPDSQSGENVLWMGCASGSIPRITGFDEAQRKPVGDCR